ncbi:MAG: carboxypeptidase regulatory-like domain-containing protein [Thermomicrobium sp.]|uniref:carboxypeptidase-like regulatory domain-containing protein n=1 Tax=Thermomicrobium sp. TaxID=1969469 RepID=UPI001B10242E|nr:carboxypeptidase-like regulatory domain-containing protein [Thermomicrobium sp.]MBO9359134.1 carboxypeptidase regulatory-like domain-containing protein [Thermomicrobium sp.]
MVRRGLGRWFLFVWLAFMLSALPAHAQEGNGVISGRVQNGTVGGGPVGSLTVTLRHFAGMQLAEERQTQTGPDGSFRFDGLPTSPQDAYLVVVRYAGVDYVSGMVQLHQQPEQTVDLTVYETTTDPSTVRIASRSLVIAGASPELRAVDIMDILIVENSGDRTYLGDRSGVVLSIPLPRGAQEIRPQPGFDYGQPRLEDGVLLTTGPLPPGSQTVVLSYTVPYEGTRATLSIGTAMPTSTLRALVRDGTYRLSSRSLIDTGTVEVSGVTYRVLVVDAPVVGDMHVVQVSGLPRTGLLFDLPTGPIIALAVGLAGLIAAAVLTVIVLRRRRVGTETGRAAIDERLQLAAELNRLDEARAAGELDETAYQEQRSAVLTRLRQLVAREQGVEGSG